MKRLTSRQLRYVVVLILGFSLLQYLQVGAVTWPAQLLRAAAQSLEDFTTRPEAGWRQASGALEKLGSRKEGEPLPVFDLNGQVVRVTDGDTVSVLAADNKQTKVRLYGIDTPEPNQPYGNAAKRVLLNLVSQQQVGVVLITTDRYGRKVGTLYRDGQNINLAMVESGYAWWYEHYAPHERRLAIAEQHAREQKLGLWQDPHPIPPWEWRQRHRH